jgi:hypothetical protein
MSNKDGAQAHASAKAQVVVKAIRTQRLAELAIDLEDRHTKKGTPPRPSEAGELRSRLREQSR